MTCSFTTENFSWELHKSNLYMDLYINLVNYNVRCQYQFVVLKAWQRRHFMKVVASDFYVFSFVFALLVLAKIVSSRTLALCICSALCTAQLPDCCNVYCGSLATRFLSRIQISSLRTVGIPRVYFVLLVFKLLFWFLRVILGYKNSYYSHVTSELSIRSSPAGICLYRVGVKCVTYRNSGTKMCGIIQD